MRSTLAAALILLSASQCEPDVADVKQVGSGNELLITGVVKELIQDARKLYKGAGDSVSFSVFD